MAKQYWTNDLGSEMWVFDTGSLPAWRNLQTGRYSTLKPSEVSRQFTPAGPFSQQDAQLFPFASQYVSGFPSATGARAVTPPPSPGGVYGPPTSLAYAPPPGGEAAVGEVPTLNPDDFWEKMNEFGQVVPAKPNEAGAVFNYSAWDDANKSVASVAAGYGPTGRAGPTAAELAIERSKVQAQNLATFVSGTIAELETEIDAKRLSTEQAIGEFNRRLDAFAEAGAQFQGIQPYTIPIGAEYAPGFQPGGIGEELGIAPRPAEVIQFDPFAMAQDIVAETPVLTDIGVPSGAALDEAIEIARGFLGG